MAAWRWPQVQRLLAVYFAAKWDQPISSPIGRDPNASRVAASDFSRLVGLSCDVGMCLDRLTQLEQAAIAYYWSLFFSRDEEDGRVARCRTNAMAALRQGKRGEHDRLTKEADQHRKAARRITAELARHRRRRDYTQAMTKLEIEIAARDLYARAAMGDGGGIACGV